MCIKNKIKNGISLITLIITIVVIIIISASVILTLSSEGGIINNAKKASQEQLRSTLEENLHLEVLNNLYDSLTGKAVDNDIDYLSNKKLIEKNEYPFQISGALKEAVENQIGRPIDYSQDQFHLVKSDSFTGQKTTTQFLYHNKTGKVITVPKEERRRVNGTWMWYNGNNQPYKDIMTNKTSQDEFFGIMNFYEITEIYFSISSDNIIDNENFKSFVANAYSRNIKVSLLYGTHDMILESRFEDSIYKAYDNTTIYNQSVAYNQRITGIHYDIESWIGTIPGYPTWDNPGSTSEEKTNDNVLQPNTRRQQYMKFVNTANNYAKNKGLSIDFDISVWFIQYYFTDEAGQKQNMYDYLSKKVNNLTVLAYRDKAPTIINLITKPHIGRANEENYRDISKKNECLLKIGVETGPEENFVTFLEEERIKPGTSLEALKQVGENWNTTNNTFGFAIHHASQLVEHMGGLTTTPNVEPMVPDTSENYVQDGLVLNLGLKNTKNSQKWGIATLSEGAKGAWTSDSKGLVLSGNNSYLTVKSSDILKISNQFTIQLAIDLGTDSKAGFLLSKGQKDYSVSYRNKISALYLSGYTGASPNDLSSVVVSPSKLLLTFTYDGNNLSKYLNTNLYLGSSNTLTFSCRQTNNDLIIGAATLENGRIGDCIPNVTIYSVRIYNRALTQSEITKNCEYTNTKLFN